MKKDFWSWHSEKSNIHEHKIRPYFHEREIWFCTLGANIGFEQDGAGKRFIRPVVIIKKFNNEVCWGLPLTTREKTNPYYFKFFFKERVSFAILSQMRLIDTKCLVFKSGSISENQFLELRKSLRQLIT